MTRVNRKYENDVNFNYVLPLFFIVTVDFFYLCLIVHLITKIKNYYIFYYDLFYY
jgi:hypothetical protein